MCVFACTRARRTGGRIKYSLKVWEKGRERVREVFFVGISRCSVIFVLCSDSDLSRVHGMR